MKMSISRNYAIPILSTLAALIIVVQCEEDSLDISYLQQRATETDTQMYNEPWKSSELETVTKRITTEAWDEITEVYPRRRRRMRKRRPQLVTKEVTPQTDRPANYEEPYGEVSQQEVRIVPRPRDRPKRRRKRPETIQWFNDDLETQGRVVVQRKRNSHKGQGITEFSDYFVDGRQPDDIEQLQPNDQVKNIEAGQISAVHAEQEASNGEVISFVDYDINDRLANTRRRKKSKKQKGHRKQSEDNVKPVEETTVMIDIKNDKSLSEFSYESMGIKTHDDLEDPLYNDNIVHTTYDKERDKNNFGPIDPVTLKEILKRSNGSSLSEILQQNNLTLADLLRGGEKAINILKFSDPIENRRMDNNSTKEEIPIDEGDKNIDEIVIPKDMQQLKQELVLFELDKKANDTVEITPKTQNEVYDYPENNSTSSPIQENDDNNQNVDIVVTETSRQLQNKRFHPNVRNKLRMRPVNSFKSQLNRELALTKPLLVYNTNTSKGKEWRNIISSMRDAMRSKKNMNTQETTENALTTLTDLEGTTTETIEQDFVTESINMLSIKDFESEQDEIKYKLLTTSEQSIQDTTETVEIITPTTVEITEIPVVTSTKKYMYKPNNRRRPTIRQKTKGSRRKHTTASPQNDETTDINTFPSSEPVTKTITTKTTTSTKSTTLPDIDDITIVEDFITTTVKHERGKEIDILPSTILPLITSSTEDTLKLEIEEILNDTRTSENLSRILSERNMSFNELLEHRERGSSQVHLADIFHNASREPNPPEPFLTKSFIEPISPETYPLRALIEANLHDPIKTTVEPMSTPSYSDIPVVMDFGNNVNENGENMGIVSLFAIMSKNGKKSNHNIDEIYNKMDPIQIKKDSEGTPYISTVLNVPTDINKTRESRVVKSKQEDVDWNELLSFIHPSHNNFTGIAEAFTQGLPETEDTNELVLDRDSDGEDVIVIESLHVKPVEANQDVESTEKSSVNENNEESNDGILQSTQSNAISVTVATASILGLGFILFLLTYAAFKWKNQNPVRKDSFCDRIPSPIFENRKGNRNNSSMRSISPILSSNIYTMSTLETSNVKDSSEYNWDTNRKPFQ